MKKIFLLAASAALVLASCAKTEKIDLNGGDKLVPLTIRISGGETRSIDGQITPNGEEGDEIGTIGLDNAYVFVFDALGNHLASQKLNPGTDIGQARHADGEEITEGGGLFPGTSQVFVVGNLVGGDAAFEAFGTEPSLEYVKYSTGIVAELVKDFTLAPLANATGEAVPVVATSEEGEALADVTLSPVISRLELVSVQAKTPVPSTDPTITAFNVTGVFLDNTQGRYNYIGQGGGQLVDHGTAHLNMSDIVLFDIPANADDWSAVSGVAVPGTDKVWGYNVAPSAPAVAPSPVYVPRLIVRLENIKVDYDGTDNAKTAEDLPGTYFITVSGYDGVTKFERGKIYRIGTTGNEFEFTLEQLDVTPNPDDSKKTLFVSVDIEQWALETPEAELM